MSVGTLSVTMHMSPSSAALRLPRNTPYNLTWAGVGCRCRAWLSRIQQTWSISWLQRRMRTTWRSSRRWRGTTWATTWSNTWISSSTSSSPSTPHRCPFISSHLLQARWLVLAAPALLLFLQRPCIPCDGGFTCAAALVPARSSRTMTSM